jgi:proline iminopeptidase
MDLHGMLPVPGGHELYWEQSGTAAGVPAIWLHGGPGAGLGSSGYRRRFDAGVWNVIGYDQRGCGRSIPLATSPGYDLRDVETQRHIEDIENLREHFGIEKWLVTGGSWGSTLALAYAQAHPDRVLGLSLVSITTTSRAEVEWITGSVGRIFPEEWDAFAAASGRLAGQRVVDAYLERLTAADAAVRMAAARAWCTWEDVHVSLDPAATPSPRYEDAAFRELFATLVVHSWANSAFLGDHGILDRLDTISHLPATLIHGRLDVSGPLVTAWELHRRWPRSRLVVVESEGHGGTGMTEQFAAAIAEFAEQFG